MGDSVKFDRRDFCKTMITAGAVAASPAVSLSAPVTARLAAAMWDFSWLTRRTAPENEYADWDSVLDALAERGYNCVRIDAFPHLLASGPDGNLSERFVMLSQNPNFMWGNHTEVEVEPRAGLIEFMQKCRDRNIRVGLSSWFQPDRTDRTKMIKTPADFTRVWDETLGLLGQHDLLDTVEWVDLCNEFPLEVWAPGAVEYFKEHSKSPFTPGLYTKKQKALLAGYMNEAIGPLKDKWPRLRFCFSFTAMDADALSSMDFSNFGAMEPHLWISSNPDFFLLTGQAATIGLVPKGSEVTARLSPLWYRACRKKWLKWLDNQMKDWARIAGKYGAPLYTTEGWGPVNYEAVDSLKDDREWDWVKDACARAVTLAADNGWRGICTSNFCGPQHPGMWNDVQWHKQRTGEIRSS